MRCWITGGCGFIGTNLIRKLAAGGGHSVRIVDNLTVGTRDDLRLACEIRECAADQDDFPDAPAFTADDPAVSQLIVGDITDEGLALRATRNIDAIIHLAANTGVEPSVQDPRMDCRTNVLGTFNYLEGARLNGVKRFVFASSGALVGDCTPPLHENLAPRPISPYGASKLAGEGYCSAYNRAFGIDTVSLRFGNIYGPWSGHKTSVVAKFIRRAMQGEPLEIYGDGNQTRDYIYIDDLIQALYLSATVNGVGGEIFQIANNAETTVNELLDVLVPIMEQAGIENITTNHQSPRKGDMLRNYSDTSKARRMLSWEPAVGLTEGLARTVAHFTESAPNRASG